MALRRKKSRWQQLQLNGETQCVKWATLPEELIEEILQFLPLLDRLSLRGVCKWWRHSVLSSKHLHHYGLPWLMLCANFESNLRGCFSVLENRTREIDLPEIRGKYLWGSLQDWLITAVRKGHDCNFVRLGFFNPFSNVEIHLPEISDEYFQAILSLPPTKTDCVVMLICDRMPELAYWVMGSQVWRLLDCSIKEFVDGVFCCGYFYLLIKGCDIVVIEAAILLRSDKDSDVKIKPQVYKVGIPPGDNLWWPFSRYYLVESCGEVLLVRRIFNMPGDALQTLSFEVFKLDVHSMVWVKLEGLGDIVLFISHGGSRSFTSKELGKNMCNCIFFSNDLRTPWPPYWKFHCNDERDSNLGAWGFYNLIDKCFGTLFRGEFGSQSVWITAPLWWYLHKCRMSSAKPNPAEEAPGPLTASEFCHISTHC